MSGILAALGRSSASGGALAVSLSSPSVFGFSNFGVPTTVYTEFPVIATATGGTPPYTYSWTRSTGPATIYPNRSTATDTYFFSYFNTYSSRSGTWICTVTDAAAASVASDPVEVSLTAQNGYL